MSAVFLTRTKSSASNPRLFLMLIRPAQNRNDRFPDNQQVQRPAGILDVLDVIGRVVLVFIITIAKKMGG